MVAWPAGSQASGYCGFYEDAQGVAFIGSQKSGYELMHRIPNSLLTTLWTQHEASTVAAGAIVDVAVTGAAAQHRNIPSMTPTLADNGGVSVSVWVTFKSTEPSGYAPAPLVVELQCDGGSINLTAGAAAVLTNSGEAKVIVATGKCVKELASNHPTHIGLIVDAGAHVMSLVVNGVLCDGT